MAGYFIYNSHVTGKRFIGRKGDCTILANLLGQGENVVIYEPPGTGKHSLVQQTLFTMRMTSQQFCVAQTSLLNVRTVADLCMRLGSAILGCCGLDPSEYQDAVATYLPGTNFVFDEKVYRDTGRILSLGWDINDEDINAVFSLPYRIARERNIRIFVYISEFQNIMFTEDGDKLCRMLAAVFKARTAADRQDCAWILTGSCVNAMKQIFEHGHIFSRQVEHLSLSRIDDKEISDHIARGLLEGGKVIERDLLQGVGELFRGNIWYVNHFAAIVDSIAKGYVVESILNEALESIIAVNEPRFEATMNDLTTFQVCLLRAIIDGHTKFSSAEVIRRYNLNSSANVRRLKDALCKKEIITFGEDDEPRILDPLFDYWVRKKFFEI